MTIFTGPPRDAIRNQPISEDLKRILDTAAQAAGVDTIRNTSGGQDGLGEGTHRTGSTRHDHGRAADLIVVGRPHDGEAVAMDVLEECIGIVEKENK